MAWQHALSAAWLRRGPIAKVLYPISRVYGVLWRRRWQAAAPPARPPIPVIIVGNVIAGGAGKTPITRALAHWMIQQGRAPAIVSKGYGRDVSAAPDPFQVSPSTPAQVAGDEPLLLAQTISCPVWVGDNRNACIDALLQAHPNTSVVICDDGLQDLSLHRDLECVVFDERGLGNGWLLPAGPLREPWPRPDDRPAPAPTWVLVSDSVPATGPVAEIEAPGPMWQIHRQLANTLQRLDGAMAASLEDFAHTDVQVVTGIAKPERFLEMLHDSGLGVSHTIIRPDHDALQGIEYAVKPHMPVIVTAKDAVKLQRLTPEWQSRFWVADLELRLPDSLTAALAHWANEHVSDLSSRHG